MNLKNAAILVVDDDNDVLTAIRLLLKPQAKEIVTEKNPENIRSLLTRQTFDLVLLDMNFTSPINTGNEGLYWLKKIKEFKSDASIIMITAYADIELAVKALKEGASDFMVKPWLNEVLVDTIQETLNKRPGSPKITGSKATASIIGNELLGGSDQMQEIFHKINKIAPTDANILILGENGTGKDLIAKAIHEKSLRANKPYMKVDVGALSETLFESELFGHKRGAFTDAREDRTGMFEAANSGTLFLDEIGNVSLQQQAKLLTVLQNRQITKIGTNQPVDVDIRLICATNVPMSVLADESRFRKDLIYRINTVEIIVPPLRQRGNDILLLAKHFCKIYAQKYMKPAFEFHQKAIDKLLSYAFPGNVRELQYVMERAVIMTDDSVLKAEDFLFSPIEQAANFMENNQTNLGDLEKSAILRVIDKNQGNITKAAKELGLTRTALYRRLNKYDI